jgi:hypothetical protein
VIVTAHPDIDHTAIAGLVPTVDLRGVTRTRRAEARPSNRVLSLDTVRAA